MNIKKTSRCLGLKELMFIGKRVGFNFLKTKTFFGVSNLLKIKKNSCFKNKSSTKIVNK